MCGGRPARLLQSTVMRKRFAIALLLAAAVWLTGTGSSGSCEIPALPAKADQSAEKAATIPTARALPATASLASAAILAKVDQLGRAMEQPAATVSEDDAAVVGEVAELQMMATGMELTLTPEQWSAFAEVSLETQAVRLNYEAEIATRRTSSGGGVELDIPMYADAGDALRQRFEARLGERLGVDTTAEILSTIGTKLEGHFAGFGVAAQTLVIRGDPRSADCEVIRTASYWNAAEGGAQLSSRRETHLPAWEDPSGVRWAALLARAGT